MGVLVGLLLIFLSSLVSGQELTQFKNGEVADAASVNANFDLVMSVAQRQAIPNVSILGLTTVSVASIGIVGKTRQCIADYGEKAAICEEAQVISSPALVSISDAAASLVDESPAGVEAAVQSVWVLPTIVNAENFNRTYLTLTSQRHFSYNYQASASGTCDNTASDRYGFALQTATGVGDWVSCDHEKFVLCCGQLP